MSPTSNFLIIGNCLICEHREENLFCHLPQRVWKDFQRIKVASVYPKGAVLCLEGQPARGVFILCTGRAKISTTSGEGKTVILRIAEPGEVLGLTSVIGNLPYEATIETLEAGQASFISRSDLLRFLKEHANVGVKVARQLSYNCKCAYDEIRSLGLSHSVPEKIARLLLKWAEHPVEVTKTRPPEILLHVGLTQEEIAQFAGSSRETVSRVLNSFKRKRWLRVKGETWAILNKPALQRIVTPSGPPPLRAQAASK